MLRAVASLPEDWRRRIRVLWAGNGSAALCRKLSRHLNLENQVFPLGGRDDVPALLLAADLMVHPARFESAGSVLIEAIAAGLPVITTAACGFATFAAEVDPQLVTPEPFEQKKLDDVLQDVLTRLPEVAEKTIAYAEKADFYTRASRAVDMLEKGC
jgi:UDP-glucose:(heptosyl)LPS alpha-1,3-glucosyltransferase